MKLITTAVRVDENWLEGIGTRQHYPENSLVVFSEGWRGKMKTEYKQKET